MSAPPRRKNASRGSGGSTDFVVVILARYSGWTMATNEGQLGMQLNTVSNDVQILLESLQYKHGETSRRWYFVTDVEAIFRDASGVQEPLPRAMIPGTNTVVLPTREGILAILREASRKGESGFVHCGVHCMYTRPGTSSVTVEENETRYTEVPDGLPTARETFIVGTDGSRLYGREFIECLSDGDEERFGETLTLSLDMSNATEFLAGIVELPHRYPGPALGVGANHLAWTTRPTNQLVVISASQRGQDAGTYNGHGALTYLLTRALMNRSNEQQASASDIARYIHDKCQTQPNPNYRQTPQIASRYPLTGTFRLLPELH